MLANIFKAYDIRGIYPNPLNEEAAWRIGHATGQFLKKAIQDQGLGKTCERPNAVVVSRDMRPSSDSLAKSLMKGICDAGMDVIDLGMCDTSIIYFAVNLLGTAGGIQVTASHNPVEYNGFKISGHLAKPIGEETGLTEIQTLATATNKPSTTLTQDPGNIEQHNLWVAYKKHIQRFFKAPAIPGRKIKVFIDGSNGMAGKMVPMVFDRWEGIEIIDLNFEHGQGVAFAHEPNPLVAKNMVPTQQGVAKHHADLGVCFDGDADRCMITDEKGQTIGCDHLTALLVDHFLKVKIPHARKTTPTIVYDLRASKVVEQAILKAGATPIRSRVGHVFMKSALRQHKGIFGGELSGHFYFGDNDYADSGAIALASVLWLLGQTQKPLSQLIAPFRKYPQSGEINFVTQDKQAVLAKLKKTFGDGKIDELDGVTIDCWEKESHWFNVRASNTEPLLRLNAEAKDAKSLANLLKKLKPMLGKEAVGH